MDYTITPQDIKEYLATKQDDDEIGYTHDTRKCLVALAVREKYQFTSTESHVTVGLRGVYIGTQGTYTRIELSEEMTNLVEAFDHMGWEGPITKRQWLESQVPHD